MPLNVYYSGISYVCQLTSIIREFLVCPPSQVFKGLSASQSQTLVRCCTIMIGVPVDPDTLHAALRLLLRLTRVYSNAMTFVEIGGHQHLLNLTQVWFGGDEKKSITD